MKKLNKSVLIILIGILTLNNTGFAQPILEWSKNYGGSNSEVPNAIENTADGGYIVAGWSDSVDGDVSGNNGGQDGWIVKLDSEGNLEWEKNYGGSDNDGVTTIKQTTDNGFIAAGYSRSIDGDLAGNKGKLDSWIIKLDKDGSLEWGKNYGGSENDLAVEIIEATDNGYVVLNYSHSNDGDVGGNNGLRDYWIVKLDNEGNLLWEKDYGGSTFETPSSIKAASNGGYIISGFSGSVDGDVGGNNGSNDSWLVKLDNEGNLEWEKNYGGYENDVTYNMELTNDGGYILVGRSKSSNGDVGGNNGEHDSWIIKLDADGNLEWGQNYGGSDDDEALSVKQTNDGGYIVAGQSLSNDSDVGGNYGMEDSWIIKLDNEGNLEWEKNYGGSSFDSAIDIVQNTNGEFIVANRSESTDVDIVENNGNSDFWLIKIDVPTTSIQTLDINSKVMISPNPSKGECTININDITTPMSISVIGTMGHTIYRKNEVHGPLIIENLPKGNYYIQIVSDEFSIAKKLIVL